MSPMVLPKEWTILYHTVLIGASPLIPIPFLDEFLVLYLRRHLVADIAKSHNKTLTATQIRQFADEPASGGCIGAFFSIIGFFIMELIRDVFFWLEWKRGIDLATQTYHFGYLLAATFTREDFNPQKGQIYRQAIKEALQGFHTEHVRNAIQKVFTSSRTVIREVRNWLFQFGKYYLGRVVRSVRQGSRHLFSRFRKRKGRGSTDSNVNAQDLDDFLKEEDPQGKLTSLIEILSKNLEAEMGNSPRYFQHLSTRLDERLKFYSDPQNTAYFLSMQSQQSSIGIASFVAGLLALSTIPLILGSFYGQRYWNSSLLSSVAAWMPCLTAVMILMGAGAGFVSFSGNASKNTFGTLGILLSGLTLVSCCLVFALVFISSSGSGG